MSIYILFFLVPSNVVSMRDPFSLESTASEMRTVIIQIHYADAKQLANYLDDKRHRLLSPTGDAGADVRSNQLWITDHDDYLNRISRFIHHLDIPIAQVLITARIISVDDHGLAALGVLFHSSSKNTDTSDNTTARLPKPVTDSGSATIPIIRFSDEQWLNVTLTALEQKGHAKTISSPELMTNDREPATIESGDEVPYQEKTGEGNTSVAFKKATLGLKVTPTIFPEKRLLLQLAVNQDKISSILVNGVPAIQTQRLTTKVMLHDHETVVLGGISEQMTQQEETGIPILSKIPLLGILFRYRQRWAEHKQLLIFVTPQIVRR